MNKSFEEPSRGRDLISPLSVGFFFILVGAIFVLTPGLFNEIQVFFRDFTMVSLPHSNIQLPAPAHPARHSEVFSAVWQFSIVWGLFQVVVLVLRILVRSPLGKKAEAVSDIVFWLGASFLVRRFLLEETVWFVFWAAVLTLVGVSLVVRGITLVMSKSFR